MHKILRKLRFPILSYLRKNKFYTSRFFIPKGDVSLDSLKNEDIVFVNVDSKKRIHSLPITTENELHWHFKIYIDTVEQDTFVLKTNNWRVWGNQGAVITDDGYLLRAVSREYDSAKHTINGLFKLKPYVYIDQIVAVIAASRNDNYFHWLFEIIPRIGLLEQSGVLNEVEKFIINVDGRSFQKETLKKIGIDDSQIIVSNDFFNFHIKARKLIIPSLLASPGCPSSFACLYLRKLFQNEINGTEAQDYIYMQRADSRTIINESSVFQTLDKLNFKIVQPEKLSVAEQAKTFSKAKVIIGAHGAGFANIVFCKPGTVILEFFSPNWVMPCYWIIANLLNLNYAYHIGDEVNGDTRGSVSDIKVNIKEFEKLLIKLKLNDYANS